MILFSSSGASAFISFSRSFVVYFGTDTCTAEKILFLRLYNFIACLFWSTAVSGVAISTSNKPNDCDLLFIFLDTHEMYKCQKARGTRKKKVFHYDDAYSGPRFAVVTSGERIAAIIVNVRSDFPIFAIKSKKASWWPRAGEWGRSVYMWW